jgi:hypothetical protein
MMLAVYRSFLHLYPAAHQQQFGQEMTEVFGELRAEATKKGALALAIFYSREAAGLVCGALPEHVRAFAGSQQCLPLPIRRCTMHNQFRFPKSTAVLMTIILAGVVVAIERARAIQASLPHVNPNIGPIQPAQHTFLPGIVLLLAFFYAAGLIGWAILFAVRRSGLHRLDQVSVERK